MMQMAAGKGGGSDFGARLLVAIPAGAIALALIGGGNPYFAIGIGLLGLVCLHELFNMFDYARPSRLAGMLGLIAVMLAAGLGDERSVLMVFMATVPLVFLLVALQAGGGGTPAIAVTLLGITWVGLALAHAVLLRDLDHGGALIVAIALGTFIGDTGAYLGGRAFGRSKLAPTISPNKTIEGLLIGIATCVLVVWYFGLTYEWMGGTRGAVLGIAVALAAPVGDLFESYLKRDSGVKDSGRLFGAHGGALDRIDAVMFAVVAGFYVWHALIG
jgi:phosphatidate cytidylyltransferase